MIVFLLSLLFLAALAGLAVAWVSSLVAGALVVAMLVALFVTMRVPVWLTAGAIVFLWWFGYRWYKARAKKGRAGIQGGEGSGATEA